MATKYGPLGNEIEKHLKRLGWSQRRLARESGIGSSTISKLMRDEHRGTPETIDAIAKALGVDSLHLMNLAGMPVPTENGDPRIDYIAQQLGQLPMPIRELAIDAVRGQIKAFYSLIDHLAGSGVPEGTITNHSFG